MNISLSILISTIGKDSLIDMLNSLKNQLNEYDNIMKVIIELKENIN